MKKALALAMFAMAANQAAGQGLTYPTPPTDNTVDEYFGVKVADPYRPLEDDHSEATMQWVEAENQVTQDYLAKIPFRGKLLKRLREVSDYGKVGAPFYVKATGKWYFYKNNGLQNQSVLYEMDGLGQEKNARVFLDPNQLSTDGTVALGNISFSHDGKYLAYAISRSGSDWSEFYVMDTKTLEVLPDHIEWAKFSGASWLGDGFFYSAYDKPEGNAYTSKNSTHKIYFHRLGTKQEQDQLFFQNPTEPMHFFSTSVNHEETVQFLYESGGGTGNIFYIRNLKNCNSQFTKVVPNMDYAYSPIATIGDKVYLLTNDGAPMYKIMVMDIHKPAMENWQTVIPEGKNVIDGADIIGGELYVSYQQDACSHIYVYDLNGKMQQEVSLPGIGSASVSGNKDSKECFVSFASFTQPWTVYQYDCAANSLQPYAVPKVNFKLSDYETKQVFYTSKDGTRVPLFITYKKGLKLNGKNPVYLYAYGGFNISMNPSFSASRIPFLERGGIYAQASLRGGGEYGEAWHEAGTKMQKQNVFDDFIAAAEYLIKEKYTSSPYLAIVGGSNGGLLVGACMTQRPDLFGVCIPSVGVMDMLRYHKFTIGWNWAPDYGTSADSKEMFEYLRGYSPLHNIKKGVKYPATLITTADHDDRVVPAHSFKFAATLQADNASDKPTLIRIDSKAGHGGGKPVSKQLEEQTDIYSFILYNMGLKY